MNKNLKVGSALSYINILITMASGFITAPLLLHSFGDSEYGAYQMVISLVGYMSILDLGLHNGTTRFVARYSAKKEYKEQANFLAVSLILFSAIAFLILAVGAVIYLNMDRFFGQSMTVAEIKLLRKLFVILTLNLALSMPGATFSSVVVAYEKFIFSRILTTMKLIIRFIMIITLVKLNIKALGLVIVDFSLNAAIILLNMIYCFSKLKIKIKLYSLNKKIISVIFGFSIFVFIASITDQINWKVDTIILGSMMGTAAVTQYSVTGQLIGYLRNFSGAISGIFLPRATKMVALGKSNSELTDLMIKVGRIQFMIVSLIIGGFCVVGKEFITLWIGGEFTNNYYWFLIIAASLVIPMTQSIGINILEAKFMHQFRAVVYLFISVANLLLTILLVKFIGISGAVIGTAAALFVGNNIVINIYYQKKAGLNIIRFFKETYVKLTLLDVITFGICAAVISLLFKGEYSWIGLFVKAGVMCVAFAASMYFFGMNKEEKQVMFKRL